MLAGIVRTTLLLLSLVSGPAPTDTPPEMPTVEDHAGESFAAYLWLVADLPEDHGIAVWRAAEVVGVDPHDLAVTCITEHSAKVWDLSLEGALRRHAKGERISYSNRDGKAGELGWCQTIPMWRVRAGKEIPELAALNEGRGPTDDDVRSDPYVAALVAAYTVQAAQTSHAKHGDNDPNEGPHKWIAHYKCARYSPGKPESGRGYNCGTCGYSKRKWERARASLGATFTPRELHAKHVKTWYRYCD
jgi:hypothetical protein